MPQFPADDLLASVSDAFRGDRASVGDLIAGVRQRARERVRDDVRERLDAVVSGINAQDAGAPAPGIGAPRPMPRPRPDRPVEIRLRNGRTVRAIVSPAVARRRDLNAVARVSSANDREAFDAIRRQGAALEELKRSQEELTKRVAAVQLQADTALVGMFQGFAGLRQQVEQVNTQTQAVLTDKGPVKTLAARQRQELRTLKINERIQSVTNVVSSAQSAAFGQRGSVFATNNLLLAGNQLLWTFLDPLLRSVGAVEGPTPSFVAILAPLGSLVTGQLALGDRQHERFISGVAVFDGTRPVVFESLRDRIASGFWEEFQSRTDVPVTVSPDRQVTIDRAQVRQGVLVIEIGSGSATLLLSRAQPLRVAWMVDTGADVG